MLLEMLRSPERHLWCLKGHESTQLVLFTLIKLRFPTVPTSNFGTLFRSVQGWIMEEELICHNRILSLSKRREYRRSQSFENLHSGSKGGQRNRQRPHGGSPEVTIVFCTGPWRTGTTRRVGTAEKSLTKTCGQGGFWRSRTFLKPTSL